MLDKEFEYFMPSLLNDVEIQNLLIEEMQITKSDLPNLPSDLWGEAYDILYDYIQNEAPKIVSLEIDFGEDDESEMTWYICGMKGVFFTWSTEIDETFYDNYESAKSSIELDYFAPTKPLDPKEEKEVLKRIKKAEKIILARSNKGFFNFIFNWIDVFKIKLQ